MPFPLFGREHFLVGINGRETFTFDRTSSSIDFGTDLNTSLASLISKIRSSALAGIDSKRFAISYVFEICYSWVHDAMVHVTKVTSRAATDQMIFSTGLECQITIPDADQSTP